MHENDMLTMRISARISGRVQGVNFRAFTLHQARELGLTGWVKNAPSGEVLTVAEGTKSRLLEFEQFLHEGPPSAHVIEVDAAWEEATGEFEKFQIQHTGI